jgi:hypothetical protein
MTLVLVILVLLMIGAGLNVLWRFTYFHFLDWWDRRREGE